MLYFAYGSNLDLQQMIDRCPDATVVATAVLQDYGLCFPRRSRNRNCGVSSVEPRLGEQTWGVVYELSDADVLALDRSEGYRVSRDAADNSYNRVELEVRIDGEVTKVHTYVATPQEDPPLPSLAYLRLIRGGARHHGLPAGYLARLDGLRHA